MLNDAHIAEAPQEGQGLESRLARVVRDLARDGEGLLFLQWLVPNAARSSRNFRRISHGPPISRENAK